MAKLKISIDNDTDFLVFGATVAALGYSTEMQLRVKRSRKSRLVSAQTHDVLDHQPGSIGEMPSDSDDSGDD